MRRAFMTLAAVSVLVWAAPALAQADIVIIDVDRVIRGSEGDIVEVAMVEVETRLIGATCTGTARTENNASEHPNNDFILESGESSTVMPDFERIAGQITSTTMALVLGDRVTASIRLGPDGVASEGVFVTLTCEALQEPPVTSTTTIATTTTTTTLPPPVTTTTSSTTTTAPPPTRSTQPPGGATTTTEAPPVGGVEAGGGGASQHGGGGVLQPLGAGEPIWLVGGGALTLLGALVLTLLSGRRISSRD